MDNALHVLFVCSGNTCRSVMAEAFLRQLWEMDGLPKNGIIVTSAGLVTAGGAPASREALTLLRHAGLEMSGHRSQPVAAALLEQAHFVLTMTAAHKESLARYFPAYENKLWTLGEFGGDGSDVADPYGGGMEAYQLAATQIKQFLTGTLKRLKKLQQANK